MATSSSPDLSVPWWHHLNRYHWFVLSVAALGWLFDCLDQQLFTLARQPAMKALIGGSDPKVWAQYGGYSTSIFLIGWAMGGLVFGILGDRIGRAKTMMFTILIYSLCTGLSATSRNFTEFAIYRFITGLGVGGEFAVGVALVAEVMPDAARAGALGLLQALSTVGNISAALVGLAAASLEQSGKIAQGNSWRWMFVVGAIPAILALIIRLKLKEPERWQQAKVSGELNRRSGFTYVDLFGDRVWRRHAFLGLILVCSGVLGLWGIGFFSPELVRNTLTKSFQAEGMASELIGPSVNRWASIGLLVQQVGAFFGMMVFTVLAQRWGRRPAFALGFVIAAAATLFTFKTLSSREQVLWMLPMMGFAQLSLFAIYAIYLPELFPTALRSTGISFCYNVGRFVAATGPFTLGLLQSRVFQGTDEPLRYAGMTMCGVFLLGLMVLPFLPETRGKALPEDERGFAH